MYQAKVYRIMIASPSDIQEEIKVAFDVLHHWNNLHSEKNKIVLLPLHWSISSYPASGKHPQKLLDKQVVEKSDLLVCVFGAKLGTPTDTEISGTVEEIKEHRKAGKEVMVFFKKNVSDIVAIDPAQLQKLNGFKESIKNEFLWEEFSNAIDFEKKFDKALQLYVNDNWINEGIAEIVDEESEKIDFSEEEKEVLTKWTKSRKANSSIEGVLGGVYYVFGDYRYYAKYGKEEVEFDDFIDRLNKVGFIDLERYDKYGKPVYKLKKAAYDYVEKLDDKME